jgi:hypothetical protein
MSDPREEHDFYAEHLLRKSNPDTFRARMQAFVDEHDQETDLKTLRSSTGDGATLSDIVNEGREERL